MTKNPFAGPAQRKTTVPGWAWKILRVAMLALTGAVLWLLVFQPRLGLTVFWQVAIPMLPLLFLVAPGIWRNVCPMAFFNQLPAQMGMSWNKRLPLLARENAYLVAVAALFSLIFLRHPILNLDAGAVVAMMISALALAFLGGITFTGKSGWCGTFCPISPIEKCYGQVPMFVVSNDFCSVCGDCQKNCYDINPNATIFMDLADDSEWYVGHRKLFFGALPGFLYWFFTTADPTRIGYVAYVAGMVEYSVLSIGLFHLIAYLTPLRTFHVVQVFTIAAILIFYWFAAPVMYAGFIEIFSVDLPGWTIQALQGFVLLTVTITWVRGVAHERAYRRRIPITDWSTGRSFDVAEGQPVLEGIQAAGIPITSFCRRGQCGSDPIVILAGEDNIEPPRGDELETLRRLGLEGKARLACSCVAHGPATIDIRAGLAVKTAALDGEPSNDS